MLATHFVRLVGKRPHLTSVPFPAMQLGRIRGIVGGSSVFLGILDTFL